MENIDKKNAVWNVIGASLNAFTSLVFFIIATRINGSVDAGIFSFAFATACIFYVIGIYEGRTFQVTDISKKYSDTDYIYNRIITCIIMMLVSVGFVLIKGYDFSKAIIIILLSLYKCLEALSEVYYAIIQKNKQLYKVGISMSIKAILSVVLFFVIDLITKNLIIASLSIVASNLLFLIVYDLRNIKKIKINKTKYDFKKIRGIFVVGFFTFILTILSIYLINSSRYAIDDLMTEDVQTIFGIILLPGTFMGLFAQYIIQPVLTKVADFLEKADYAGIKKLVNKLFLIIIGCSLLVIVLAYFLEAPVLGMVYGIDLKEYIMPMMVIIFGSIMYSFSIVTSYILIALRKTLYQVIIYSIASITSLVLSYMLVRQIGVLGASINYLVSMSIVAVSFIVFYYITISKKMKMKSIEKKDKEDKKEIDDEKEKIEKEDKKEIEEKIEKKDKIEKKEKEKIEKKEKRKRKK